MMAFSIVPGKGALPITFEMTPPEVAKLVGIAKVVEKNFSGEKQEYRESVVVRYSQKDGRVVEISFLPGSEVRFEAHSLFGERDLVAFLSVYDPTPYLVLGFLVFKSIGITITGFHDGDDSQRAITVFRLGRWDEVLREGKRYQIEKETRE